MDKSLEVFPIVESSLEQKVFYTRETVKNTFLPLVEDILHDFEQKGLGAYCVGIAGPPGCGKSSISSVLQKIFLEKGIILQVLPLDGFHLSSQGLKSRRIVYKGRSIPLYWIKGAKETYDTRKLLRFMNKLKTQQEFYWPVYSRQIHDPVEKGIAIHKNNRLFIVEGNYLFLDEPPWSLLSCFFEKGILITSKKRILKKRIIKRKTRGGYSKREARSHYRFCDRRNIREVLEHSAGYNYLIQHSGNYSYRLTRVPGRSSREQV
ncbi:MAG: AAA family ATPase [Spirochaetota bacterium]